MNKKLNIFNTIISIIVLIGYIYNMIVNGQAFLKSYNVNMLYIGAGIGITLIMFSLFKLLRDGMWMDLIYMIYLLLFVGFNIYAVIKKKNWNLYAIYYCYYPWVKYVLGFTLLMNIINFILGLKGEKNNE